jgi:hypothetical protein
MFFLFNDANTAHKSHNPRPYSSLPHSSFLLLRSSRAARRLGPHFLLISSRSSTCFSFATLGALHTIATSTALHLNCFASASCEFLIGSASRSRRISSKSAVVRWYDFSYGVRTGGGNCWGEAWLLLLLPPARDVARGEPEACCVRSLRRGSDRGRNLVGVWYMDGAAEGGL